MSFLTLNGLPFPVYKNSFREVPTQHGDIDVEAADGAPFESRTNRLRRWTFRTKVLAGDVVDKYIMWAEAWGHGFDFESKKSGTPSWFQFARTGMGPWTSGTHTQDTTTKKRGASSLSLGSGAFFGILADRTMHWSNWVPSTHGWTLFFWAYHTVAADSVPADGWYFYCVKGAAFVTRGSSANPSGVKQYRGGVLGSYGLGNVISVLSASPYVGVAGYTLAAVAAAKNYDQVRIYPFEIEDDWVATVSTYLASNTGAMQPEVLLGGDCLSDPTEPRVIARSMPKDQVGVNDTSGVFEAASYEVEFELREVPR